MKTVILDSSVIIKWFKSEKETHVKQAEVYLKDFLNNKIKIIISPLTILEIINNALFDKYLPYENWQKNIGFLFKLDLEIASFDKNLFYETLNLGKKYQITTYDASYIALAKKLKAEFITADKKLVKKVKLSYVRVISNFSHQI